MSLRFSDSGPAFPRALIDALIEGNVVFLCGSGISIPQLPNFKELVDNTYQELGLEKETSEQKAYDVQRFEEVLGALSRRLVDPKEMVETVSGILAKPKNQDLEHHRTVLRLSRDISNRVLIITTNFDTLLERALGLPSEQTRQQSFAGQSLPAPGGADFSGIIHIHGRIADSALNLDQTPLVLTSADYGDAYMRSGWASRFLFDLARCKTIVLIGYSANDAPVRYFLNVLEADRARFPDLHPIYALDAYESDPAEVEAEWGTLAVTPIPYCKFNPETGESDYSPLWNDLHQLAGIVERPKQSREELARKILSGKSSSLTERQHSQLSWLFSDRDDLWPVARDTITDTGWFNVFQDNKLWSAETAAQVISTWISRNFEDHHCFATAIEWHEKLGGDFISRLGQQLRYARLTSPFWRKAWRILLSIEPTTQAGRFNEKAFSLIDNLGSGLILDRDLREAVNSLVPKLTVRPHWRFHEKEENDSVNCVDTESAKGPLSDLALFDLNVADEDLPKQIIKALNALDEHALRILDLASEALRSSLLQLVDLERITKDRDGIDYTVPSIEDHGQNETRNGVMFLVRAIVNAFRKAVALDRDHARAQAMRWQTWPGRIGTRLLLHVARDGKAFSADEALDFLLKLKDGDFWDIRREFALVLRDRAGDATPACLRAVEARILSDGEAYFARYPLKEGEVDWRTSARDNEVWLRLRMLDQGHLLSKAGQSELTAIIAREPHLDREIEDADFFHSYFRGVRFVEGDSTPIKEAAPDDRLTVARGLRQSPDITHQMGWKRYCRSDAKGAFEALMKAEKIEGNLIQWDDFLAVLASQDGEKRSLLDIQLVVDVLRHLEALGDEALQVIAGSVIDLLLSAPHQPIENLEDWCDRLWFSVQRSNPPVDFWGDLYQTAINHPAGRLVQVFLTEFDHTLKTNGRNTARQRDRLASVAGDNGPMGVVGRAVLICDFAFLLSADAELAETHLLPRLNGDTEEARGLRAVLVSHGNITPKVTKIVSESVVSGVIETPADSDLAQQIASGILRPALASVRGDTADEWGIPEADVRRTLCESPPNIRIGTLKVLARWMRDDKDGPESAWKTMVAPFFTQVWPKERRFVDERHNDSLTALAVRSGKHFPDALVQLRPFFCPYAKEHVSLYPIKKSNVPEAYPKQVLDLLWILFSSTGKGSPHMAEILDRLVAADPSIEIDRRYQSLEQRTVRFR